MKRVLAIILILFIVTVLYAQTGTKSSANKSISIKIQAISTYQAKASLYFGKMQIGEKTLINQSTYTVINQINETVNYEENKPVEYIRYFYDKKGNNTKTVQKTWDREITNSVTYYPDNQPQKSTSTDKEGKIIVQNEYEIEKNNKARTVWNKEISSEGIIKNVICTFFENEKPKKVIYYNDKGGIDFVEIIDYKDKTIITTRYNEKSEIQSVSQETYNEKNELTEMNIEGQGDLSFMGNTKYVYKYKYDNNQNWIEKTEYKVDKKYGSDFWEPIEIQFQNISYTTGNNDLESIEPKELFQRKMNMEKAIEINTSKISVSEDIDVLDDKKKVSFIVDGTIGKGIYGETVTLVVRGKELENPELYINWHSYLGSDAYVTSRVGSEEAKTEKWSLSTDSKATFYPNDIYELIGKLKSNSKYIASITPYNESPITVEFDINELKELFEKYRDYFSKNEILENDK
jgi:hypothetical protein